MVNTCLPFKLYSTLFIVSDYHQALRYDSFVLNHSICIQEAKFFISKQAYFFKDYKYLISEAREGKVKLLATFTCFSYIHYYSYQQS